MSLRWRIMGSLVAVILLSVLISVGVGYYATQHRLGVFVDRIGDDEAVQLARNLSRAYSAGGGWETVERAHWPRQDTATLKQSSGSGPKRGRENTSSRFTGILCASSSSRPTAVWSRTTCQRCCPGPLRPIWAVIGRRSLIWLRTGP